MLSAILGNVEIPFQLLKFWLFRPAAINLLICVLLNSKVIFCALECRTVYCKRFRRNTSASYTCICIYYTSMYYIYMCAYNTCKQRVDVLF